VLDTMRKELTVYGRRLLSAQLVTGAGGNISARVEGVMLISPSGLSLEDAEPDQYVAVDVASGAVLADNGLRPSSEVLMHLAIYRSRPDVRAVVHAHPQYLIALTSSGHDLRPMFADAVIYLGKDIPHIPYITVTTPELARAVEQALKADTCSMVLRNHGVIAVGSNLKQAFWRASTAEEAARIQFMAILAGQPRFLTEEEMADLESLQSETYRRTLAERMRA
jgi:L-fuculose-phosphate aldolase